MTAKKKMEQSIEEFQHDEVVAANIRLLSEIQELQRVSKERAEKIRELESEVEGLNLANRAHEETNLDLENDNAVLEDRIERIKVAMNTLVDSF